MTIFHLAWIAALGANLCLHSVQAQEANASKDKGKTAKVEDRYRALETFARALYYLETLYVEPEKVEQDKMVGAALKGIVDTLDPHTMVMPRKAFEQLTNDTHGKFGGVGIIVSQERGRLIVVSPIEDSPAFEAGVKAGDEIVAIDGMSIEKMKGNQAVDRMRGEPGSVMNLNIKRKGSDKVFEFKLTRRVIAVKSVRGQELGSGVVYARIASFQENTATELKDLLKKHEKTMQSLVLDLRDNPGGLLDQAVQVSDLFIESGIIVSTVGRDPKRVEREFAHKRDTFAGFPMVVLVNEGSASAAEIVAGALQDHERAMLLGTTTFGKGSVQTLVSLPDGSGLKLTVARYYTPKDRSIQAKGIAPDVVLAYQALNEEGEPAEPKKAKENAAGAEEANARREANLKNHIEAQDLSEIAKNKSLKREIKDWAEPMRADNQIVTAFVYLRGFAKFGAKKQ